MKKPLFILLTGMCCVLLVLVFFLPDFFSSSIFLSNLLTRLNRNPSCRLQVENCSLGWLKGLTCTGVQWADKELGVSGCVRAVNLDRGLLALLAAPDNLGTIHLDSPVLQVNESVFLHRLGRLTANTSTEVQSPPFWEDLRVILRVENGRLETDSAASPHGVKGALSGSFALAGGVVRYRIHWQGQGEFKGRGSVNLPARQSGFLDTLVMRLQLDMAELRLSPLFSLLSRHTAFPDGEATCNGRLFLVTSGRNSIDVKGGVQVRGLKLAEGSAIPGDIRLDQLDLQVDGFVKAGWNWRIDRFELVAPPGSLSVSGSREQEVENLRIRGVLQLPALVQAAPDLFPLRKETVLTDGKLDFFFDLKKSRGGRNLLVDASVESLAGQLKGLPFSWAQPLVFSLDGEQGQNGLRLNRLLLSSAFIHGEGHGTLDDFGLHLEMDLEKLSGAFAPLVSFDWQGRGTISMDVGPSTRYDDFLGIPYRMLCPSCSLLYRDDPLFVDEPFELDGTLSLTDRMRNGSRQLSMNGDLASVEFTLDYDSVPPWSPEVGGRYILAAVMDLERLSPFCRVLSTCSEMDFSGRVSVKTAGFVEQDQVILRELRLVRKIPEAGRGKDEVILMAPGSAISSGEPVYLRSLQLVDDTDAWQRDGYGLSRFDRKLRRLVLTNVGLKDSGNFQQVQEVVFENINGVWRAVVPGQPGLLDQQETLPPACGPLQKLFPGLICLPSSTEK